MSHDTISLHPGSRGRVADRIRQAVRQGVDVNERQRYRSGGGVLVGALVMFLLLSGGSRDGGEPCPQPTYIGVIGGDGGDAPQQASSGDARVTENGISRVDPISSGMVVSTHGISRADPATSGEVVSVSRTTVWADNPNGLPPYGG